MDFRQETEAHGEWRWKLRAYLAAPDGSLAAAVVGRDDLCLLGEWMYGEGRRFAELAQYSALLTHHASLHEAAAGVIERADRGETLGVETSLMGHSPFTTASNAFVRAMRELESKLSERCSSCAQARGRCSGPCRGLGWRAA